MSYKKLGMLLLAVVLFIIGTAVYTPSDKSNTENDIEVSQTIAPKSRSITITATGDCTLATDITTPTDASFESKVEEQNHDYTYFLRNFKDLFSNDDLTIVNFEGTLSTNGEREDKQFAFRGNPEYVNILTSASVEAANLANNHSRDYGEVSLLDTKETLNGAGIVNFIGDDIAYMDISGIKVGLVGINALNDEGASSLVPHIKTAKDNGAELVILSIHWGIEKEAEPTDEQRELAHKAVDAGADLVIGTHPHVIEGIEKYNGRYIVYSLGNFCFGGNTAPSDMDTMVMRATLTLDENNMLLDDDKVSFIPCRISSSSGINDYQPCIATGEERVRIEQKIKERTELIAPLELTFE